MPQPRNPKRQKIATLGRCQRVEFVEDNGVEVGKEITGVRMAEEQCHLFGRCQQNVRRLRPLPGLTCNRRIAGARFGANFKAHVCNRCCQIAGDIGGKGFQRRYVEGSEPCAFFLKPPL